MSMKSIKPLSYKGSNQRNRRIPLLDTHLKDNPTIINGDKIIFKDTKTFKWGDGIKKNHLTFTLLGDSPKMKEQCVLWTTGGTSPSIVGEHLLYPNLWKDKYPNKSNRGEFKIYIPKDEINTLDDIYRLTKSGKYSHLNEWNEDGEVHNIIPLFWTREKKGTFRGFGDFTHSIESVLMIELLNIPHNHIEHLRLTSDIEVVDFDELGEGMVCILNPKMSPRWLNIND